MREQLTAPYPQPLAEGVSHNIDDSSVSGVDVCLAPTSGAKADISLSLLRADIVAKVPKYLASNFSKETKLTMTR